MLDDKSSSESFWCPTDEIHAAASRQMALTLVPSEWAALSRLGTGEWVADAQILRLEELGLVERAFGQALLTRLGRTLLGHSE